MKIEILCTGDEILTGKTVNTNHSYIAQRLTEAGLQIHWGTTVGDDRNSLSSAFHQASERADAVIVNGGLGPTVDDLSQELAAKVAGVELELNKAWLNKLEKFYLSRGRDMPANNRKQAMLPSGCEFIDNPIGTACGFAVDINQSRFFFTPGVPREMRLMLDEQIIPRLLKLGGIKTVTRIKRFHTFGIGESRADEMLTGIEHLLPESIKLGFQTHFPQLETKLAAIANTESELDRALAPAEKMIREQFRHFILCEDAQTLEGLIIEELGTNGVTITIAEMGTGGNICKRLVTADTKSEIVQCGVVGQNVSQLARVSGLSDECMDFGVDTAKKLAEHLRLQNQTDYALSVLVALNSIGENQQSALEVVIAIATDASHVTRSARLMGNSQWTELGSTEMALDALRRFLFNLPIDQKTDFELS